MLHDAVEHVLNPGLAARYVGPFALSGEEAAEHAHKAGFDDVRLERVTLSVELSGGAEALVRTLDASGIASDVAVAGEDVRTDLISFVRDRLGSQAEADRIQSTLTSSLLVLD